MSHAKPIRMSLVRDALRRAAMPHPFLSREQDIADTVRAIVDSAASEAEEAGRAWLGTVFGITPSGKVYAPWACRNLDTCEHCHGTGKIRPAMRAPKRLRKRIARIARERRGELTRALLASYGPYCSGDWPEELTAQARELDAIVATCKPTPCPRCGGYGTAEGYDDSLFHEALEKYAGSLGLCVDYSDDSIYLVNPESDPWDEDSGEMDPGDTSDGYDSDIPD